MSDFAMPGMNGLETLMEIGKDAPSARAVLMTGNTDDLRLGKKLGMPLLRKPLDSMALEQAFNNADKQIKARSVPGGK